MTDDTYLSPETYPVQSDVTSEQLRTLAERFNDSEDEFGESLRNDTWPPRDGERNIYPIYFEPSEVTKRGNLIDDNRNPYDPFRGNLEPTSYDDCDACNAPLNKWRERYPQIRYCGAITYDGRTFCVNHKNRIDPTDMPTLQDTAVEDVKSAEELIQTGLFTTTIDHFYSDLDPLKKLAGWGSFESLMGESAYEFAIEYEPKSFDFSDAEIVPPSIASQVNDDGEITVKCGYPTENVDPALSLYVAAMMGIQMITVQPRIMYENENDGERMMESKTIETAQLTAPPTEHDPSPQEFKTLETWTEHHLNLPLSRLVTDRPKLLERGGVGIDVEDAGTEMSGDDIVLSVQADPDGIDTEEGGTDPNAFEDNTSPSEEIVDKAGES